MKKYVITDPCYILPNKTWEKICTIAYDGMENGDDRSALFNALCSVELNKLARTKDAIACETGIGDWCNQVNGLNVLNQGSFCADSGMVCVVEYTQPIEEALKNGFWKISETKTMALVGIEGVAKIKMDTSDPDWTVVKIKDCLPNGNVNIIESLQYEEKE